MRKILVGALIALFALLMFGCTDPAANKPKAILGSPAPEAGPAKPGAAERLTISPDNSKVEFVAAKVTRTHNGSFKQFTGTIDLVNNKAEESRVTIDIQTNSVVTDDDGLTKHLQTPDFFDANKFPKATFTSTKIEANSAAGGTHTVTGNFDLHGFKRAITFPATIQIAADSVTMNADFSINRKDWNLLYPGKADDLIHDLVAIKLSLKVPRK